jgi:hypothetical protein
MQEIWITHTCYFTQTKVSEQVLMTNAMMVIRRKRKPSAAVRILKPPTVILFGFVIVYIIKIAYSTIHSSIFSKIMKFYIILADFSALPLLYPIVCDKLIHRVRENVVIIGLKNDVRCNRNDTIN